MANYWLLLHPSAYTNPNAAFPVKSEKIHITNKHGIYISVSLQVSSIQIPPSAILKQYTTVSNHIIPTKYRPIQGQQSTDQVQKVNKVQTKLKKVQSTDQVQKVTKVQTKFKRSIKYRLSSKGHKLAKICGNQSRLKI